MEDKNINPNLFVVYLEKGRNSSQKMMQTLNEMQAYVNEYIKKEGERWIFLPADRTEVVYISPYFLTEEDANSFDELKESIYKMIENKAKKDT